MTQAANSNGASVLRGDKKDVANAVLHLLRGRTFIAFNFGAAIFLLALYLSPWRPTSALPLLALMTLEAFVISLAQLWASGNAVSAALTGEIMKQEVGNTDADTNANTDANKPKTIPDRVSSAKLATIQNTSVAACSVIGHRKENQDAYSIYTISLGETDATLLVVCDGVGGEESGGRAAREAVKLFARLVPKLVSEGQNILDRDSFKRLVEEHFSEMVHSFRELSERESLVGLTTTVVAALIYDNFLAYWWAGDSRAYLLRDRRLSLLSRDHTVPVEMLNVDPLEVHDHEDKSKLTRGLHPEAAKLPDVGFETLKAGDVVFLCSDGVWESCSHAELQGVMNYFLASDLPLDRVCQYVLNTLSINTTDNATITASRHDNAPPPHNLLDPGVLLTRGLRTDFLQSLYAVESDADAALNLQRITKPPPSSPRTYTEGSTSTREHAPPRGDELACVTPAARAANGNEADRAETRICLNCAVVVKPGGVCCPTPDRHAGFYLLMTAPDGRVSYHRINDTDAFLIGREAGEQSIVVDDQMVASRHVEVRIEQGGEAISFRDLETDNGTFLSISSHRARLPDLKSTALQLGRSRVQVLHTSFLENGLDRKTD